MTATDQVRAILDYRRFVISDMLRFFDWGDMLRAKLFQMMNTTLCLLPLLASIFLFGCRESSHDHQHGHSHHGHSHTPPHGGTAVILGDEQYHIEFVHDTAGGKLQAYILDGHMDKFIRLTNEVFQVSAQLNSKTETLSFKAVATPATGERVGDSALFEAEASWLKTATNFSATIPRLIVRGQSFENVQFQFPGIHD